MNKRGKGADEFDSLVNQISRKNGSRKNNVNVDKLKSAQRLRDIVMKRINDRKFMPDAFKRVVNRLESLLFDPEASNISQLRSTVAVIIGDLAIHAAAKQDYFKWLFDAMRKTDQSNLDFYVFSLVEFLRLCDPKTLSPFVNGILVNLLGLMDSTQRYEVVLPGIIVFRHMARWHGAQFSQRLLQQIVDLIIGWKLDLNLPSQSSKLISEMLSIDLKPLWGKNSVFVQVLLNQFAVDIVSGFNDLLHHITNDYSSIVSHLNLLLSCVADICEGCVGNGSGESLYLPNSLIVCIAPITTKVVEFCSNAKNKMDIDHTMGFNPKSSRVDLKHLVEIWCVWISRADKVIPVNNAGSFVLGFWLAALDSLFGFLELATEAITINHLLSAIHIIVQLVRLGTKELIGVMGDALFKQLKHFCVVNSNQKSSHFNNVITSVLTDTSMAGKFADIFVDSAQLSPFSTCNAVFSALKDIQDWLFAESHIPYSGKIAVFSFYLSALVRILEEASHHYWKHWKPSLSCHCDLCKSLNIAQQVWTLVLENILNMDCSGPIVRARFGYSVFGDGKPISAQLELLSVSLLKSLWERWRGHIVSEDTVVQVTLLLASSENMLQPFGILNEIMDWWSSVFSSKFITGGVKKFWDNPILVQQIVSFLLGQWFHPHSSQDLKLNIATLLKAISASFYETESLITCADLNISTSSQFASISSIVSNAVLMQYNSYFGNSTMKLSEGQMRRALLLSYGSFHEVREGMFNKLPWLNPGFEWRSVIISQGGLPPYLLGVQNRMDHLIEDRSAMKSSLFVCFILKLVSSVESAGFISKNIVSEFPRAKSLSWDRLYCSIHGSLPLERWDGLQHSMRKYGMDDLLHRMGKSFAVQLFSISWAAAVYCTASKLRTIFGGPMETFEALEKLLQNTILSLNSQSVSSQPATFVNDGELNVIDRARIVLLFICHLEQQLYNAYEGTTGNRVSSAGTSPVPIASFFKTNRKVCVDWMQRLYRPLLVLSRLLEIDALIIVFSEIRLKSLVEMGRKLLENDESIARLNREFLEHLVLLCRSHVSLQQVDEIKGILIWSKHSYVGQFVKEETEWVSEFCRIMALLANQQYEEMSDAASKFINTLITAISDTVTSLRCMAAMTCFIPILKALITHRAQCLFDIRDWGGIEKVITECKDAKSMLQSSLNSAETPELREKLTGLRDCFSNVHEYMDEKLLIAYARFGQGDYDSAESALIRSVRPESGEESSIDDSDDGRGKTPFTAAKRSSTYLVLRSQLAILGRWRVAQPTGTSTGGGAMALQDLVSALEASIGVGGLGCGDYMSSDGSQIRLPGLGKGFSVALGLDTHEGLKRPLSAVSNAHALHSAIQSISESSSAIPKLAEDRIASQLLNRIISDNTNDESALPLWLSQVAIADFLVGLYQLRLKWGSSSGAKHADDRELIDRIVHARLRLSGLVLKGSNLRVAEKLLSRTTDLMKSTANMMTMRWTQCDEVLQKQRIELMVKQGDIRTAFCSAWTLAKCSEKHTHCTLSELCPASWSLLKLSEILSSTTIKSLCEYPASRSAIAKHVELDVNDRFFDTLQDKFWKNVTSHQCNHDLVMLCFADYEHSSISRSLTVTEDRAYLALDLDKNEGGELRKIVENILSRSGSQSVDDVDGIVSRILAVLEQFRIDLFEFDPVKYQQTSFDSGQEAVVIPSLEIERLIGEILPDANASEMDSIKSMSLRSAVDGLSRFRNVFQSYCQFLSTSNLPHCDPRIRLTALRLLSIICVCGPVLLAKSFSAALELVPASAWLGVVPQLCARVLHADSNVWPIIVNILVVVLKQYPRNTLYEVLLIESSTSDDDVKKLHRRKVVDLLLSELGKAGYGDLVDNTCRFANELRRVASLLEESWGYSLQSCIQSIMSTKDLVMQEAEKVLKSDASNTKVIQTLRQNYTQATTPAISLIETAIKKLELLEDCDLQRSIWFKKAALPYIINALDKIKNPMTVALESQSIGVNLLLQSGREKSSELLDACSAYVGLKAVCKPLERIRRALLRPFGGHLGHSSIVTLSNVSSVLSKMNEMIAVPLPCVSWSSVSNDYVSLIHCNTRVDILATKTRPKLFSFDCSDGSSRSFLLKGREDLRLDSAVMQNLDVVNGILMGRSEKRLKHLASTYNVVSLSADCGLVEWLHNASPLFDLYLGWCDRHSPENIKKRPAQIFWEKVKEHASVLDPPVEIDYKSIKSVPVDILKSVFADLSDETPQNLIEKELWCSSGTLTDFRRKQTTFQQSCAIINALSYVLGVGDRHLNNILLDYETGNLTYVDFNVCFGRGRTLNVPETVPFRLTHSFVKAMGIFGVDGLFRHTFERVLSLLSAHKELLARVLTHFAYDSFADWLSDCAVSNPLLKSLTRIVRVRTLKLDMDETSASFDEWVKNTSFQLSEVSEALRTVVPLKSSVHVLEQVFRNKPTEVARLSEAVKKLTVVLAQLNQEKCRLSLEREKSLEGRTFASDLLNKAIGECESQQDKHIRVFESVRGQVIPNISSSVHAGINVDSLMMGIAERGRLLGSAKIRSLADLESDFMLSVGEFSILLFTCAQHLSAYRSAVISLPSTYVNCNTMAEWGTSLGAAKKLIGSWDGANTKSIASRLSAFATAFLQAHSEENDIKHVEAEAALRGQLNQSQASRARLVANAGANMSEMNGKVAVCEQLCQDLIPEGKEKKEGYGAAVRSSAAINIHSVTSQMKEISQWCIAGSSDSKTQLISISDWRSKLVQCVTDTITYVLACWSGDYYPLEYKKEFDFGMDLKNWCTADVINYTLTGHDLDVFGESKLRGIYRGLTSLIQYNTFSSNVLSATMFDEQIFSKSKEKAVTLLDSFGSIIQSSISTVIDLELHHDSEISEAFNTLQSTYHELIADSWADWMEDDRTVASPNGYNEFMGMFSLKSQSDVDMTNSSNELKYSIPPVAVSIDKILSNVCDSLLSLFEQSSKIKGITSFKSFPLWLFVHRVTACHSMLASICGQPSVSIESDLNQSEYWSALANLDKVNTDLNRIELVGLAVLSPLFCDAGYLLSSILSGVDQPVQEFGEFARCFSIHIANQLPSEPNELKSEILSKLNDTNDELLNTYSNICNDLSNISSNRLKIERNIREYYQAHSKLSQVNAEIAVHNSQLLSYHWINEGPIRKIAELQKERLQKSSMSLSAFGGSAGVMFIDEQLVVESDSLVIRSKILGNMKTDVDKLIAAKDVLNEKTVLYQAKFGEAIKTLPSQHYTDLNNILANNIAVLTKANSFYNEILRLSFDVLDFEAYRDRKPWGDGRCERADSSYLSVLSRLEIALLKESEIVENAASVNSLLITNGEELHGYLTKLKALEQFDGSQLEALSQQYSSHLENITEKYERISTISADYSNTHKDKLLKIVDQSIELEIFDEHLRINADADDDDDDANVTDEQLLSLLDKDLFLKNETEKKEESVVDREETIEKIQALGRTIEELKTNLSHIESSNQYVKSDNELNHYMRMLNSITDDLNRVASIMSSLSAKVTEFLEEHESEVVLKDVTAGPIAQAENGGSQLPAIIDTVEPENGAQEDDIVLNPFEATELVTVNSQHQSHTDTGYDDCLYNAISTEPILHQFSTLNPSARLAVGGVVEKLVFNQHHDDCGLDQLDFLNTAPDICAEVVDNLINEARNPDNLCMMYEGWTPWV